MGGLAFADHKTPSGTPPHVPRMSPALYESVAATCQEKLETIFSRVVIPRDAPGKKDYGDVDFLVHGPIVHNINQLLHDNNKSNNNDHSPNTTQPSDKDIFLAVKSVLSAPLHLARGDSHSYGIPHPEIADAYVQVDVELSPGQGGAQEDGEELFEWTRLMKGDADLMQVVGIMHRGYGLTCNDRGLHLRVEEIESYDKKKSLIFLTRSPNTALSFYGYNVSKYHAGFTDETDLFDWVSGGRFFSPSIFSARTEKANDRQRQTKRPMYRRFVEEYMAKFDGKESDEGAWTRETVLKEALRWFGKQGEYDEMIERHRRKEAEEKLWGQIRAVVPCEGNSLTVAMKGLRRWVEFQDDGKPRISREPNLGDPLRWSRFVNESNREEVLSWMKENWAEAKGLEKARAKRAKEMGGRDASPIV